MARLLALIVLLLLSSATRPRAEEPATVMLSIRDFTYDPAEITVPRGTIVVWTNRDDMPHTVTGDAGAQNFASGGLDTDETFSHRFDEAGRFSYFCSLHPRMQGVVL